jgi:3-methyladenine DNA glycosylase/8-oxoguanine DNA glycosylase
VRAILGQQVSVKGATTLAGRLVRAFGEPMDGGDGLTHVFPTPEALACADYSNIGLPAARAAAIRQLASTVARGELTFSGAAEPAGFIERLKKLPGIGEWTAQYVAMRALGEPDAFPAADLGLLRAAGLATAKQLEARAERWRPWRAYAAMHLWQENAHDQLHVHGKSRRAVAAGGR